MNRPTFQSSEIRNALAVEFMRIAGCKRVEGTHGHICEVHEEAWTDSGCLTTIDAANDLLIPVLDVLRDKVLPATKKP